MQGRVRSESMWLYRLHCMLTGILPGCSRCARPPRRLTVGEQHPHAANALERLAQAHGVGLRS